VSSPYEPPAQPELRLNTARQSVNECVAAVLELCRRLGIDGGAAS
jgi:adenylylsulfate kinase-like enzyme